MRVIDIMRKYRYLNIILMFFLEGIFKRHFLAILTALVCVLSFDSVNMRREEGREADQRDRRVKRERRRRRRRSRRSRRRVPAHL